MNKWLLLCLLLPFVVCAQQIDFDKVPYKSSFVHLLHPIDSIQAIDSTDTGYSTVQYHSFSSKGQFIKVRHQQFFTDYLLFNINFDKFSQEGIYNRENLKLHNVQTNLLFNNKRNNYQAKLYLGYHKINMDENGGIINYDFSLDDPLLNDVYLLSAHNEAKNRNHSFYQNFNLTDKWSIHNEISILSNRRMYSDQNPNSGFYQDIYNDSIQTYDSLSTIELNNHFGISYKDFTISQYLLRRKAHINNIDSTDYDLGIGFNYSNKKHNIFLNSVFYQSSHLDLLLSKCFAVNSSSHILLLNYERNKIPILVNEYESNHYRFNNDFSNTTTLNASYTVHSNNYSFSSTFKHYTDFIYLDNRSYFQQYDNSIVHWINKLAFTCNWKRLYIAQSMEYQYSDRPNILRFPDINSTTSLWLESNLFSDNLNTQFGTHLNYFTAYYAYAYNPALAQYHLQDSQFIGDVSIFTAFLNLKLDNMSIKLKYRNLTSLFNSSTDVHYTIPNYPNYPSTFQLSVVWKLNNLVDKNPLN